MVLRDRALVTAAVRTVNPGHLVVGQFEMTTKNIGTGFDYAEPPWFPEVLVEIERLAKLPEPPCAATINAAKHEIKIAWADTPRPTISTWREGAGGIGLDVRWERRTVSIWPGGDHVLMTQ